jgi:hypothetical protein
MFLDAGHQYEALLDVMLVLGNNSESGGLLSGGCQEIISMLTLLFVLHTQQSAIEM